MFLSQAVYKIKFYFVAFFKNCQFSQFSVIYSSIVKNPSIVDPYLLWLNPKSFNLFIKPLYKKKLKNLLQNKKKTLCGVSIKL